MGYDDQLPLILSERSSHARFEHQEIPR